jgi:NAD(P)-dependent dehydrogenase (short-subunit alcohol dehydrogenase family)
MAGQVPLGRVGQPDEIAKAVLFLASIRPALSMASNSSSMAAWPRSERAGSGRRTGAARRSGTLPGGRS